MVSKALSALLLVVGLINLAPVAGVLSAGRLQSLYGLDFTDPDLVLMMRHRALLFGLLGAFIVFAAFRPALQPLAMVAALVSMAGFLVLGWPPGDYGAAMQKIFRADVVGLALLAIAAVLYVVQPGALR